MELGFSKTWEHGEKYGAQLVFYVQHKKTFRDCISKGNTILNTENPQDGTPQIFCKKYHASRRHTVIILSSFCNCNSFMAKGMTSTGL